MKKLILAFPPFSTPTAAPLGVCMLKSYMESHLPEWQVKVLDLNLETHDLVFQSIEKGHPLNPQVFSEGNSAKEGLLRAAEVFKGSHSQEFYESPEQYTVYAELFSRLFESEGSNFLALEHLCRSDKEMPPLIKRFATQILEGDPDAVGISICFSQQFWAAVALAKEIKRLKRVPIIFGGTFFCGPCERFLREFPDIADYVISGEGEIALASLLDNFNSPEKIPGLAYLKEGEFRLNDPIFPSNLDELGSPNFSDLDLSAYYAPETVLPVLSSRGCYWRKCAFCVHYKSAGLTYRVHSIPYIIEFLQSYVEKGITHFSFIDEMISPPHFHRLAQGILDAGLSLTYYALAKPVKEFSAELLSLMYKSGCRYILWGLESGSQRVLDLMDKGTNIPDIKNVLHNAHKAGIRNHVYIIIGFPTETKEEVAQTLEFLDENKDAISFVHRGTFTLDEDSPVHDNLQKYSITRIWRKSDNILQMPLGYEVSAGLQPNEAKELFIQALPFLRAFNPFSRYLGNFRDHSLLVYSRLGKALVSA